MPRILIAIDVPRCNPERHFNGVMRYLSDLIIGLSDLGFEIKVLSPDLFKGFYLPKTPEVRISFCSAKTITPLIDAFDPDFIHIEYEGNIGRALKKYCNKKSYAYTTCFHSRYDLHVKERFGIPMWLSQPIMFQFHRKSYRVMTRTETMLKFLKSHGINQVAALKPTVNSSIFYCKNPKQMANLSHPKMIYSGRIAKEKNLDAFLSLNIKGEKIIIGDGPDLKRLKNTYPNTHFLGYLSPYEISNHLNQADVFVMPSKTETLGRNMLEAMACGLPIAAYPENGPKDIIKQGLSGWLSEHLDEAIQHCLDIPKQSVLKQSAEYIDTNIATEFLKQVVPANKAHAKHQGEGKNRF